MPSSHSALVCALCVAVGRSTGLSSPIFSVAFVFAFVVMFDAMGVRREVGIHAKILNKQLKKDAQSNTNVDEIEEDKTLNQEPENEELKEFVGHTPIQVLAGALLGIFIAIVVPQF